MLSLATQLAIEGINGCEMFRYLNYTLLTWHWYGIYIPGVLLRLIWA